MLVLHASTYTVHLTTSRLLFSRSAKFLYKRLLVSDRLPLVQAISCAGDPGKAATVGSTPGRDREKDSFFFLSSSSESINTCADWPS